MADIVLESPFGPEWLAGDKINELEFCKQIDIDIKANAITI